MAIGSTEVQLWHLPLEQVALSDLEQFCAGLLTPDERERGRRFAFERDRCQFMAARGLLRTVLSRYAAVDPGRWRFRVTEYGKPHIESPVAASDLRFSITHTPNLVAVVVAAGMRVGVDAECLSRPIDWQAIGERYFAPEERQYLATLPHDEQQAGFFRIWTLKEAFLKAIGTGLSTALDAFRFELVSGQPPQVHFSRILFPPSDQWRFWLLAVPPDQQLAVAVEHPSDCSPRLVVNLAELPFDRQR